MFTKLHVWKYWLLHEILHRVCLFETLALQACRSILLYNLHTPKCQVFQQSLKNKFPEPCYSKHDCASRGLWTCSMLTCLLSAWPWPGSSDHWKSRRPPRWAAWEWPCCSDKGSRWYDSPPRCHWWRWASVWAIPASGSKTGPEKKSSVSAASSQPASCCARVKQSHVYSPVRGSCWVWKCTLPPSANKQNSDVSIEQHKVYL